MNGISKISIAYIGLGSNLGNRAEHIANALEKLNDLDNVTVEAVSGTIETSPLGGKDQPDYLNAVAKIKTSLDPKQLLKAISRIEDSLDRTRNEKWSSRSIDLDILLYGDKILNTPELTIPHSRMHLRSFVLRGLCELSSDLIHPVLDRSVKELTDRLNGADFTIEPDMPQLISVAGIIGAGKTTLAAALSRTLNCEMLPEAYDTNPYLADEYAGKAGSAFDCEMYFLKSRIEQLKTDALSPGAPIVTDYIFDKQLIYAGQWLDKQQMAEFTKSNNAAAEIIRKPVLVIYLKTSPEICLQRIHKRNRPYEQQIQLRTLEKLSSDYEHLFADWRTCPVIEISTEEFDSHSVDHINSLTKEVQSYICKSQKQ